jgi:hypothetical protein
MFDIADESLALSEVAKWSCFAAMRALWSFFLNPSSQTFLASHFTA